MKILIVGGGSIGQRHLRNLMQLGQRNISIFDIQKKRLDKLKKKCSFLKTIAGLEDVKAGDFDCALICTPSAFHLHPAMTLAKKKINLFIEKPVSHTLQGLSRLLTMVKRHRLVTMVGCNYRYHPGLMEAKKMLVKRAIGHLAGARIEFGFYLPDWHPWEDYRNGYSAQRKMGGGVLLDRIHEVDYASWLFGKPTHVLGLLSKQSRLKIDVEDSADILLRYSNDFTVSIHLDYIQRKRTSTCEIFGNNGTILWQPEKKRLLLTRRNKKKKIWSNPRYQLNRMYVDEMKHFLKQVRTKKKTCYSVEGGAETLKIVEKIRQSSKRKKWVKL